MLLDALVTIGDEIAQEKFPNEYVSITVVDSLSGNQEIHSVVVLDFVGDETGLTYQGARTVDPTHPSEMAVRYGYVNRYNQYDHSLTQRASTSLDKEIERLLEWPTNERIGSHVDEPLIHALGKVFDSAGDSIRENVADYDDAVEYKALLTVSIEIDGEVRYPARSNRSQRQRSSRTPRLSIQTHRVHVSREATVNVRPAIRSRKCMVSVPTLIRCTPRRSSGHSHSTTLLAHGNRVHSVRNASCRSRLRLIDSSGHNPSVCLESDAE